MADDVPGLEPPPTIAAMRAQVDGLEATGTVDPEHLATMRALIDGEEARRLAAEDAV